MLKLKVQSEEDHITKRPRGEKTSGFQQEAILQWLEIESNFNWLNGGATKGMKMVVAGAKVSKASALQDLADHVNEKCGTKWHKDKARETLRSYKDIYKKTMWYISIKAMKLIEAGKDPEQTKAFLNALGYMQIITKRYCKTIAIRGINE